MIHVENFFDTDVFFNGKHFNKVESDEMMNITLL